MNNDSKKLIETIQSGQSILFLGMDFFDASHPLPSQAEFARSLMVDLPDLENNLRPDEICEVYQQKYGRNALVRKILDAYKSPSPLPGPFEQQIAKQPIKAIITTRYDQGIEKAFEQAGRRVSKVIGDIDVAYLDEYAQQENESDVVLIKLRGCVSQPQSLIITQDDHIRLSLELPARLRIAKYFFTLFHMVFIEHHPGDEELRRLFIEANQGLAEHTRRSYAIWKDPEPRLVDYWRAKNLYIWDATLNELLTGLQSQVAARKTKTRTAAASPYTGGNPYKFLDYYTEEDAGIFFGRETEKLLLTRLILGDRLTVIFGPSGSGKSSLIRAGVIPALREQGYQVSFPRVLSTPEKSLQESLNMFASSLQGTTFAALAAIPRETRLVLIFDQFEEIFTQTDAGTRRSFFETLKGLLGNIEKEVRIVLAIREDFLAQLHELADFIPNYLLNAYRLKLLNKDQASLAITEPAALAGVEIEPKLLRSLLDQGELTETETQVVPPTSLQIVCYWLYTESMKGHGLKPDQVVPEGEAIQITHELYEKLGGVRKILGEYLEHVLGGLSMDQENIARNVLKLMVGVQATKVALSSDEILNQYRRTYPADAWIEKSLIEKSLQQMCSADMRLVRNFEHQGLNFFELAHENMVPHILNWFAPEEIKRKQALDLFEREFQNWKTFGHLLDQNRLSLLEEAGIGVDSLDDDKLGFVLRSAVINQYRIEHWVGQTTRSQVLKEYEDELLSNWQAADQKEIIRQISGLNSSTLFSTLRKWLFDSVANETKFNILVQLKTSKQAFAFWALANMSHPEALALLEQLTPTGMVFIPAGSFLMGNDAVSVEQPAHQVFLSSFYIQRYPITNEEFREFLLSKEFHDRQHWTEAGWTWKEEHRQTGLLDDDFVKEFVNHPATTVSWYEAFAFAHWKGLQLPTEAQWEKAARSTDGRPYPWGTAFDRKRCNSAENYSGIGTGTTTPVDKYSPDGDSPYGVSDMLGNVWEWTRSRYFGYPYSSSSGRENMEGSAERVIRGGSWLDGQMVLRTSCRDAHAPSGRDSSIGFRLVFG